MRVKIQPKRILVGAGILALCAGVIVVGVAGIAIGELSGGGAQWPCCFAAANADAIQLRCNDADLRCAGEACLPHP